MMLCQTETGLTQGLRLNSPFLKRDQLVQKHTCLCLSRNQSQYWHLHCDVSDRTRKRSLQALLQTSIPSYMRILPLVSPPPIYARKRSTVAPTSFAADMVLKQLIPHHHDSQKPCVWPKGGGGCTREQASHTVCPKDLPFSPGAQAPTPQVTNLFGLAQAS